MINTNEFMDYPSVGVLHESQLIDSDILTQECLYHSLESTVSPHRHVLHGAKGVAGPALVAAECISAKTIRELLETRFITHRSWRVHACLRAAH